MTQRRYDLDWLRIAAFGLLILYHVGMFYVTWDWHVKSDHASTAIEPLMRLVNPWRLSLLFLISGVATRFMADKLSSGALAKARLGRLLPPLILAVLVIVPPQSYYEVLEALGGPLDPLDFYRRYVTASGNWCDADGCLITPTYNHMWFVAYLIVYTLIAIAVAPLIRRAPEALALVLRGPGLLVGPWLFLFAARVLLSPIFGETHAIWDDWYLHTIYLTIFLFGFAIAKHEAFFAACVRQRWLGLGLAISAYAALETLRATWTGDTPPDWLMLVGRGLHELQAWAAIVAAFGFAHRFLAAADTPLRRYLTEAIFPFYLLHQTIIVVAGYNLDQLGLPLALEASALIALTLLGCWLGYEIAKRLSWLRVWFGIPSRTADSRATSIEISRSGAM